MTDYSKLIFHSGVNNFTFVQSGYVDFDVTGTYTPRTTAFTSTVATGIDTSTQYVMAFVTEEKNQAAPYTLMPELLGVSITSGASTVTAGYYVYYEVDAAGNLNIKVYYDGYDYTNNVSLASGSYPIVNSDEVRVVYYVFDMPSNINQVEVWV